MSFTWKTQAFTIIDSKEASPRKEVGMRFDLRKKNVHLLDTDQMLPFHPGQFYTVELDDDFEPIRFWILENPSELKGRDPELVKVVERLFQEPFTP